MPLLPLFQTNPEQIYTLQIEQIVKLCGDGKLRDNSECSVELREYLSQAPSEKHFEYIKACLDQSYPNSGFVLQDLVNELGRRLDHRVENGLYQGRSNAIGCDGLWFMPDGHGLIVEVKTTDAYRINLDKLAGYRTALLREGRVTERSSILVVVGRQDTGDLEAQVRGSKHAWDIRLISADALIKLVTLKEETEENTIAQIHQLLIPFEYTKVDRIIDVAFTAARDVGAVIQQEGIIPDIEDNTVLESSSYKPDFTPTEILNALRLRIVTAFGMRENTPFIKKSSAMYWSKDRTLRVACTLSKEYDSGGYWYCYHQKWDKFLSEGGKGYFILGCVGRDEAFALPFDLIHSHLENLHTTVRENTKYWHVYLDKMPSGELSFRLSRQGDRVPITEFRLALS